MKILIIGIVLFFVPRFCSAQNTGSIVGIVTDSSGSPLELASVNLLSATDSSKLLTGTITDRAGKFYFSNIPIGNYIVHVKLVGFTLLTRPVSIKESEPSIQLGTLILVPQTYSLKEIEITAIRNMIKRTEEGIVLNASENITQIGGTAADLLKNMPGVVVDGDGGISLRGKSPLILINGRVSGISGADRSSNLEQIPASSIERIEIISNPSAKYDADAEGGIINIILKKNTNKGTNGAFVIAGGFGERYRLNGGLLLNHKKNKWNFGMAYDNWYTTRARRVNGDRIQFDLPNEYYLTQRRSDERIVQNQNARVNIEFAPTSKSSFSFDAFGLFQGEDNRETLFNTIETATKIFTGRNKRFSNEIRRFHSGELSFAYNQKFANPEQSLAIKINSAFNKDRENTDITTQSLSEQYATVGNAYLQQTHSYTNSNLTNISFDYSQPLHEKAFLEAGYKTILRFLENDFLRQNEVNGNYVIDAANTDVFNFNEQIHALYALYTSWVGDKKAPTWKYSLGLRAEGVNNIGSLKQNVQDFNNTYYKLFPSASLIYYTEKRNMVRLSYSRRINRPSFGQLIPFTDITDSLNQRAGNPKLRPELSHSLDLTYNIGFSKGNLTNSLFFRQTADVILPFTTLNNTGIAFTELLNFGSSSTYGFETIFSYNPSAVWGCNFNLSAYDLRINAKEALPGLQRNQWAWFTKFINNFTPWENGKIQFAVNYTSPVAIPQGERINVYFADLGFQQKILKGQGRLGLTVTDIFNTQRNGQVLSDMNYTFSRITKVDTRAIMLTFGYTFRSAFKENLMENKFKND
ncbi:TonB-dependent receptor domain-containing protein [Lacibacter sp.]|uniref:TonB-dependent receptor domain-containing protein n=1 Tax=Lacibacter sp. TaxID=1915409 RepID=UPI002B4B17F2|nr:TonB-dependent receptor [Lacibacter sp.]HLP38173.1 TonB-dependent receptor [Lacibacter sp.]